MAVTESSLNPMVREMSITILMTVRPLSYACGYGTEMLLILKKYFRPDCTVSVAVTAN